MCATSAKIIKETTTNYNTTDRQTAAKQKKKTMKNSQLKFKTNSYVFNKLYPNKIDALTWFLITTITCT